MKPFPLVEKFAIWMPTFRNLEIDKLFTSEHLNLKKNLKKRDSQLLRTRINANDARVTL